jgi:site-specific DNA-methyltransferase (adenine-specific)
MWEKLKQLRDDRTPIVLFGTEPFSSNLRLSNIKEYKYDWIWEKSKATGFLNAKKQPLRAYENIHIFYKKSPKYNPQMSKSKPYNKGIRKEQTEDDIYGNFNQVEVKSEGNRYPRNVVYFKTAESEGSTYHKTQKPLELIKYLINTYTNKGDLVLDFASVCLCYKK